MALSHSARIELIEQAANALANRSYSQISMALAVFGIDASDPYDSWGGGFDDEEDYVRKHLVQLDDERLLEFRDHATSRGSHRPTQWEPDTLRMFCSHLVGEKDFVSDLVVSLERYGISGFVAHQMINPSDEWREAIEAHLSDCDLGLAFVHEGFFTSEWTSQEIGWILGGGRPVISLRFDADTPPQGFLSARQAIDARGRGLSELTDRLVGAIRSSPRLAPTFRSALLTRLERARSYYDTMAAAAELADHFLPVTAEEADRVRRAMRENTQVGRCVAGRKDLMRILEGAPSPEEADEPPF